MSKAKSEGAATASDGNGEETPLVQVSGEADRQTQPIDTEEPPRLPFPVVGIGASAGGLEAISDFLSTVRPDSGMAYVFIQHLPPTGQSMLVEILEKRTVLPVFHVDEGMPVRPDHLYVTRPGHTLSIRNGAFHLGPRLNTPMHNRPVDDFFKSLAEEQRERAIAIVMSGMGSNGTAGAQAVKAVGGLCIAQDPESTQYSSMPQHLIDAGYADYILHPHDMPAVLVDYAGHPYVRGQREEKAALAKRDQNHLREILAILQTRTHQDFSGYKKPTVLRRIQRRMGLNRISKLWEYARLLRQNPAEVTALADDLLIHVTGFFRDPQAWKVLRKRVIIPLVASRQNDQHIRCWVTACSSGEEAYTLAMLLVEESELAGKTLDIKVFATDMAERSLQNARSGTFTGGIESEVEPTRLERFFQKEDAVYRVRPELRERVIFAPQNILQDPPFSRLDIVSCRNLLIYLEPEMQARILGLLHFGLREGGTLFLGTSETVAANGLFEPIDKEARIYRRLSAARYKGKDFVMPRERARETGVTASDWSARSPVARPTMAQMVNRALAEHLPAAVAIDREQRIVYYHGNTEPFISLPHGEPTGNLLEVARESLRGAIRTATASASSTENPATVLDGWIDMAGGRQVRIAVTASPLNRREARGYLLVSFQERGEHPPEPIPQDAESDSGLELQCVREELQRTIEQLQTSNEELKASNEEVISTNEELQSTNEELETSREEMQSLNEELNTVNAQLRVKIEEHQATSNDLSSLLTSTDIAVLFLDPHLRIRRFTPATKDLLDMIPTDVGRPLADLARKFTDPELANDGRTVLERLVPIEREIAAANGHFYQRRVLPYRTTDNRIDGVVVTFVDITDRYEADRKVRASEDRLKRMMNVSGVGVLIFDEAGTLIDANDAFLTMTGYTRQDVTGKKLTWRIMTPTEYVPVSEQQMQKLADIGTLGPYEKEYVRKDGSRSRMVFAGASLGDGTIIEYCIDIEDRKKIERALNETHQQLAASKAAAEEANRIKDEFLATLSHELRTPLGAILLWTKLLQDGVSDEKRVLEGLNAIQASAEAQKELIEDLLDMSRITMGGIRMSMRDVDLASVVREALDTIRPTGDTKGVSVTADLDETIGVVRADPDRLRQIIWNLLSNAVKFTPSGGKVELSLKRRDQEVEIRVRDTGRGINADFLPHVFDRFRQADYAHTRAQSGLGLGLAIAKQLVELHGGTIEAHSEGVGKGATFIVTLPLSKVFDDAKTRSTPAIGEKVDTLSLKGSTALLVEDDAETAKAVGLLLRQHGMEVTVVESTAEALKAYDAGRPDVIISDIGLPQEDGYAMIRQVRAREKKKKKSPVPAIALTAFARDVDQRQALQAGFQLHVGKPVSAEVLMSAVRKLIAEGEG